MKIKLGEILFEEKETIGVPNGMNLDLIGVSNDIGLHKSRAKRIADLSRYKLIKRNWFAYNPMRINVGSIGFAFKDEHIGIVSPDYVVFSCSDKILPEYLLYILKSDEGIESINKNASGAVRKRLYFSNLANTEIYLPPIEVQKKRINYFRNIEKIISKIKSEENVAPPLYVLRQSILRDAVEGKLTRNWRNQRPNIEDALGMLASIKSRKEQLIIEKKIKREKSPKPITEDDIPFNLPEDWTWVRLGTISEYIQRGKSPKYTNDSSIPVLSQKCVQWEGLQFDKARFIDESTIDKYQAERFLKNGDLLWNSTGDGTVGRLIEFKNSTGFKKVVVDSHVTIVRLLKPLIPAFFLTYLSTEMVQDNLVVSGSTKQTELNKMTVVNTLVPLPSLEEQKLIVLKVQSLLQKCKKLDEQIKKSEDSAVILMQAVLKEAFEPIKEKNLANENFS